MPCFLTPGKLLVYCDLFSRTAFLCPESAAVYDLPFRELFLSGFQQLIVVRRELELAVEGIGIALLQADGGMVDIEFNDMILTMEITL